MEKIPDIEVTADWVRATTKGNFSCPDCGSSLIISIAVYTPIAFCPKCKCYFIDKGARKEYYASKE